MAVFSAFVRISKTLREQPALDVKGAAELIRKTSHDSYALDFEAAIELIDSSVIELKGSSYDAQLRHFLIALIRLEQPWWLRLVPYGRDKLRMALDADRLQCFKSASLFDEIPDSEVVAWWDELGSLVRGAVDSEKMISAREAERLSLEHERKRLHKLGIAKDPLWVALDDNTLGYDILSYDLHGEHVVSRLVEVKSTKSDAIFVTRNEWNNALTAKDRYVFHVWKMPEQRIEEFPVNKVGVHIPQDRGKGIWQNVQIAVL